MKKTENSMPSHNTFWVISFGLLVLFGVFGLLGGWMYYAPLASSSVANGKLSAGAEKKIVQHLEGGIVDKIHVKDGDVVQKGQVLITLREVQIKENYNILESQYQDMLALYARLEAQRDERNSIHFSDEITNNNLIINQKNIFETSKRLQEDEEIITRQRITQQKEQINGLRSIIETKERRLASIEEERVEWEALFAEQLVDKSRIRELSRESNLVEGDITNAQSEILRVQEQISELQTQLLLQKKEFRKETLKELVKVKSTISDLKSKMVALKDRLNLTKVVSPADGTVFGMDIHTIGGVIPPGKEILSIVPKNSKLLIEAEVQTTDIDKVKVGLHSDLMFPAFNMKKINIIEGKVVSVSADSFVNQQTGIPFYEAKIEVTPEGMETLKENNFVLVPGMPATAMIKLGDSTVLNYIIKPFKEMVIRGFNEE
jgi:epimerase transport system membrane fusion protein